MWSLKDSNNNGTVKLFLLYLVGPEFETREITKVKKNTLKNYTNKQLLSITLFFNVLTLIALISRLLLYLFNSIL